MSKKEPKFQNLVKHYIGMSLIVGTTLTEA